METAPNIYSCISTDNVPASLRKHAFNGLCGACHVPDGDGQGYLLSIDLRKENMFMNDVGLKLKNRYYEKKKKKNQR